MSNPTWLSGLLPDTTGVFIAVATTAERDALPSDTRRAKMLVRTADGVFYELGAGLTNADWTVATFGSGGASIPAPALAATSNIALTGIVTVDSVASNTVTGDVLATAQTTTADNGYWTPNAAGAWTRPTYYNSDATVAALRGQISGTALNGTLNKGATYYQFSGATIAGAKIFVPTKAPARINANESPWFLVGDGVTDQSAKRDVLLAYAATLSLGCTVEFGRGTYIVSTPGVVPPYVNIVGAGMVATVFQSLSTAPDPFDVWLYPAPLNVGKNGAQVMRDLRVINNTINNGTPKWLASSSATVLNQHYRAAEPHSHVLKLTTKSGSTGAFNPIGELNAATTAKMLGTAGAAGQFLIKFITYGQLGTMQFQLSVNAGTSWSATQNTTVGDYNDFLVDTVMGGSTYGATCKVRLSNFPAGSAYAATAAGFTMPAVAVSGTTPGTVTINLTSGTTAGLIPLANGVQGWVFVTGAGLMHVDSVTNDTSFVASNVGASSAVAPGTVVAAGGAIITVLPPAPRIEVIGTPPSNDYIVDFFAVPGPLGRTRSYYYGAGTVAQDTKHKVGLSVSTAGGYPAGGITTVAGAYHDYAIPATSLTLRVHTGILSGTGSWSHFTSAAGWSMEVGTTVADGANVWTIVRGPACVRSDGVGNLTLRDVWLEGGAFNLIACQSEQLQIEGNCVFTACGTAKAWFTNSDGRYGESGQFTNNCQIHANMSGFGDGYGIVHDGGFGFQVGGGYSDQSSPFGWLFLAGLAGGEIVARYIEGVAAGKLRNSTCFGRLTAGFSPSGIDFGGSYWGSLNVASALDLYTCDGLTFTGITFGGTSSGLTGCANCTNLNVIGGFHLQGKPIIDASPSSGFISAQGFELSIGKDIRPPASLGFANGANVDITVTRSDHDITGPTAVFSSDGFVAGSHGQRVKLRNRAAFAWTINHNSASEATAANQILTPSGAAVSIAPGGTAELEYSTTDTRWVLVAATQAYNSIRSFSGTTDTVLAADLQGDVESTGAAAVTVTVPTMPAGFVCTYSQQGAGALSFVGSGVAVQTALGGGGTTTAQYQARTLFYRSATVARLT